jgi:hypothetical protein
VRGVATTANTNASVAATLTWGAIRWTALCPGR